MNIQMHITSHHNLYADRRVINLCVFCYYLTITTITNTITGFDLLNTFIIYFNYEIYVNIKYIILNDNFNSNN